MEEQIQLLKCQVYQQSLGQSNAPEPLVTLDRNGNFEVIIDVDEPLCWTGCLSAEQISSVQKVFVAIDTSKAAGDFFIHATEAMGR